MIPAALAFDFTGRHRAELVERHEIAIEIPAEQFPHGVFDPVREEILTACIELRDAWADAHKIEPLGTTVVERQASGDNPRTLGIEWRVVVGKGTIDPDQRIPGVMDNWTWSGPRREWWRAVFNRNDGRQGRSLGDLRGKNRFLRAAPETPFSEPVPAEALENDRPLPFKPPTVGLDPPWSDPTRYDGG